MNKEEAIKHLDEIHDLLNKYYTAEETADDVLLQKVEEEIQSTDYDTQKITVSLKDDLYSDDVLALDIYTDLRNE